jgi:hypothetical protein
MKSYSITIRPGIIEKYYISDFFIPTNTGTVLSCTDSKSGDFLVKERRTGCWCIDQLKSGKPMIESMYLFDLSEVLNPIST